MAYPLGVVAGEHQVTEVGQLLVVDKVELASVLVYQIALVFDDGVLHKREDRLVVRVQLEHLDERTLFALLVVAGAARAVVAVHVAVRECLVVVVDVVVGDRIVILFVLVVVVVVVVNQASHDRQHAGVRETEQIGDLRPEDEYLLVDRDKIERKGGEQARLRRLVVRLATHVQRDFLGLDQRRGAFECLLLLLVLLLLLHRHIDHRRGAIIIVVVVAAERVVVIAIDDEL